MVFLWFLLMVFLWFLCKRAKSSVVFLVQRFFMVLGLPPGTNCKFRLPCMSDVFCMFVSAHSGHSHSVFIALMGPMASKCTTPQNVFLWFSYMVRSPKHMVFVWFLGERFFMVFDFRGSCKRALKKP